MPYCPECGAEVKRGVKFCPECGTRIAPTRPPTKPAKPAQPEEKPASRQKAPKERSNALTAGSTLTIIAAIICIIEGVVGTLSLGVDYGILGIAPLIIGLIGLFGGISALEKTRFSLAIGSLVAIVIVSIFTIGFGLLSSVVAPYTGFPVLFSTLSILAGITTLLLGILSITFIATSKREFEVE